MRVLFLIFVLANFWAFSLMGFDKGFAQRGMYRIPEKALFLPVLLGGGIGGTAGMFFFRHKTRHWYFRYGFPAIAIAQVAILLML